MRIQYNQYNQYKYNQYKQTYYTINNPVTPNFKGQINTIQGKFNILLAETKKIFNTKQNIELKDFEAIIKKISPTTSVKSISQIPPGSNVSPGTGAYFSQKTNINPYTNDISVNDKIIYLNPLSSTPSTRLKLFGDFIHESTHVAQEESIDRLSTIDFIKKMLQSPIPTEVKIDTLIGGTKGFESIEYNVVLPLIYALRKCDDMPNRIIKADPKILNMLYERSTQSSTTEYIKAVTNDIIKQLKTKLPNADEKYILKYIHKKAGQEKEAYKTSLDFLKDTLKIQGDTDLDLRVLLYENFEKTIKEMIK